VEGTSGSGKTVFSRFLESELWTKHKSGNPMPVYVSLAKVYRRQIEQRSRITETEVIEQALQQKITMERVMEEKKKQEEQQAKTRGLNFGINPMDFEKVKQQEKLDKEMIDIIRKRVSFVFILDGFDEIVDRFF